MRAAGILLVRPDGSVLLQLRDDQAPTDANRWAIPGGLVNSGERPKDAARREIHEEPGSPSTPNSRSSGPAPPPTVRSPPTCTAPPPTPAQKTS
ncbi:NUDIX domain-containing protein [Allorhizocola rhizosphaerae]|uniref:NUDIX domain-containing protein n=1 Tax=Allorhizocola rhizosphaerae TaxID=1872709 RepID=UPI000E3D5D85|nr:NUDIX hydrolase [Allorhizocola rhizosphaerae]